jgi:Alpha/beta hydrolase domain
MPKTLRFVLPLLALALPQAAHAKQGGPSVSLEIASRTPAFGGRRFGTRGAYEQIIGKAHMRIDPRSAANRGIVDLARAPRDADGLVNYDVDVFILRPQDPAKSRRVLFYDVVNRGMRLLSMMSGGSMNPNDPGDGLLMRQGYTLVWSGWQGDINGKGLIGARFPVATAGGKPGTGPVTGRVSTEMIFDSAKGDRITLPYPAAALTQPGARLTVRQLTDSPEQTLAPADWRFADERHVTLTRPANMDAGAIYRFDYTARDPWVMGLGFAATRDLVTWLRRAPAGVGNPLADIAAAPCDQTAAGACVNPAGGIYSSAVAFGGSQSGRYLRDFLWQGFNRAPSGARVFDGVIPFIPGARRTFTNFRFAEPGRFSRQHEDHDVPGFTFPFAYASLRDPQTGRTDGILRACTATATGPKLFHVDTSGEFWQAGAGLVGTGGTGRDVPFPANVRAYMIAGGSHAPGFAGPKCRYPANPLNYTPIVRALLLAMVDWTAGGSEPPPSKWPSLARGELVPFTALRGPASRSTGLKWPKVINQPGSASGKPAWPLLAPAIDADGNDVPGIRLPEIAAPKGTYLGWNIRKAGYAEGGLCFPEGSYLPFAQDSATRGDDPRLSLAERYPAPGAREARAAATIADLRREGFLLEEDAVQLASVAGTAR